MRWTSQASACLVAVVLAGCNGGRDHRSGNETGSMSDTSGMSGSSSDTSGMSGMSADTGMSGGRGTSTDTGSRMRSDTSSRTRSDTGAGMRSDSAKANQTKSGVTNTKTGKSTLGPGVTKTRPDQGQPVTSKGDTLSPGADSATQR
jgi:hypothetical protein